MKKALSLLLVLVLILSLTGCGGSDKMSSSSAAYDGKYEDYIESPGEAEAGGSYGSGLPGLDDISSSTRKRIYIANITAETKDFDSAKDSLDQLISQVGGYVEYSDISGYGQDSTGKNRRLRYTIRVPAAALSDFLAQTGELMNIVSNTMNMDDVTNEYVDIEARLNTLNQEERRLLELLDKAESLEDIIQLEDRLSQVRYEIESYIARIKVLDGDIQYSKVELTLRDVTEYSSHTSFGSRIGEAFTGGWSSFAEFMEDFLILLIEALPFLLLIGVVVVVVILIVKRANKKQKRKMAAGPQFPPQQPMPPQPPQPPVE